MSCIFCEIIARRQPADVVHEDDEILVFKDINPTAPIHVLLVPRAHVATVNDIDEAQHTELMGRLFVVAKQLAAWWGIVEQGYRLQVNVGRGGGQIVDHVHMHLVSGRRAAKP